MLTLIENNPKFVTLQNIYNDIFTIERSPIRVLSSDGKPFLGEHYMMSLQRFIEPLEIHTEPTGGYFVFCEHEYGDSFKIIFENKLTVSRIYF
jgi:hypothetical protein